MAVLLSRIPGYGLTRNDELIESCRPDAERAIAQWIEPATLAQLERNGIVRIVGHFEAFPEHVKQWASQCMLRPPVCFDRSEGCVWVDASCAGKPNFAGHVLAAVGIMASVKLPHMLELWSASIDIVNRAEENKKAPYPEIARSIRYRFELSKNCEQLQCLPQHVVEAVTALPKTPSQVFNTRRALDFLDGTVPAQKLSIFDIVAVARLNAVTLTHYASDDLIISRRAKQNASPASLSTVAEIATTSAPTLADFVSDKSAASVEQTDWESLSSASSLLPGSDVDWAKSPDDEWPIDDPNYLTLSSYDVRPLARLHARVVWADRSSNMTNETQIGLVKTVRADMPSREVSPGSYFPIVRTASDKSCRIERLHVAPHLDWAVAKLSVAGIRRYDVRALISTWSHQAGLLKSKTDYLARLSFWARNVETIAEDATFSIEPLDAALSQPQHKLIVSYERAHSVGKLADESFVEVTAGIAGNFKQRLSLIVPVKLLHACGPLTKGMKLSVTGYFLIGDFVSPVDETEYLLKRDDHIQPDLEGKSDLAKRRYLRLQMSQGRRSAYFQMAQLTKNRSERASYLESAAKLGHVPAMCALGLLGYEIEESNNIVTHFPVTYLIDAVRAGSEAALKMLALPGSLQERLPIDIAAALIKKLAIDHNNGLAQYALALSARSAREHAHAGKEHLIDSLYANFLMHAVINGVDTAGEELAQAFCQGIGVVANPLMARGVLNLVANRGYLPAQYWMGAFDQMGPKFFSATRDEKRRALSQGIQDGLSTQQILLGLFYELDAFDEPNALLIAHGLYSWVANTLHDPDALELKNRVLEKMSASDKAGIEHFDLWGTLGMQPPPASVPLTRVMGQLEGPITMHPAFLRCLDPELKQSPTERLLSQVSFFAGNSARYKLGFAAQLDMPESNKLKLSSFGVESEELAQNLPHLLVCSAKTDNKLWDVTSIYPFFPSGFEANVTLQAGLVSDLNASAVLLVSATTDNRVPTSFTLFDPLWPLMRDVYQTGETYRVAMYGLVDTIEPGKFFLDSLPSEIRKMVADQLNHEAGPRKLVSFSCLSQENAAYRINAVVREVDENYCSIAGIDFMRVDIDPFLAQSDTKPTFPVMVPKQRLPKHWKPTPGERVDILMELHGYAIANGERETKILH